ncbi:MAG TPA: D-alanine--D-alanine ligase family protein [Candidatus Limnocylindria bacterium]|nr:D-alanine--D-alanine ligase family protein [Candidatus Limnocylindria bacterium]
MTRQRVAVVFGGRSGEHEISVRSARAIVAALDPARYEVVLVGIDKQGRWRTGAELQAALDRADRELVTLPPLGTEVTLVIDPTAPGLLPLGGGARIPLDVAFPILHGTFGEDGAVQGLFEMAGLPYVGAGVLASAAGMDKCTTKALLQQAGIPVCKWIAARAGEPVDAVRARITAQLGFPCFVKPANLGSSVGISKVHEPGALAAALESAAAYDARLIVEGAIDGRELECAVLGSDEPETSVLGELIPSKEWYDYEDKYVGTGTQMVIPAPVDPATAAEARRLAAAVFRTIGCSGLARVDFFLERRTGRLYVNEINTMPGCTPSSMFPKMWEATGVPFPRVVERLLALALERHAAQAARRYSFSPAS